MTLYPDGYGTAELSYEQMVAKHGGKMHPEYRRRLFAYLESQGGRMGIGGGWRSTQPTKPGFAPDGRSFHQDQRFASGFVGYAAVDLVMRQPGQKHRAPTWAECADAPDWGLHTFIKSPPEPWHMQCIEMRGWQSWVNAGRPDPLPFVLPGTPPTQPPPTDGDDDVAAYLAVPPPERFGKPWLYVSSSVRPATTFDIDDGVPQRKMEDIPVEWRVAQYDALAKSAGL
jgi:hypothetical protein